jgi:DNA-binding protein HU-beta
VSGYTIGEIVIWLLLAAGLGFALGWVAKELVLRTRSGADTSEVRPPVTEPEPEPAATDETTAVKKPPARKTPAKKTAAKKTAAKKTAARKTPAKKAAAKKTPAKQSGAKKTAAKKAPVKKATPPQQPDDT